MDYSTLQNFIIAIAIGGLIGLEREIGEKIHSRSTFAGFRTFILISFFGAVSYFIGENLNFQYLTAIAFSIFSALVIVTYYITAKDGFVGITSELTSIITFLLGVLVMQSEYQIYAVIFAVLITILLAFKKYVHDIVQKTKLEEWYDTLKFAFIAFVVLPLLPNADFGPYGFFNPYKTWLMVVFVSAISFLGYFAIKIFGTQLGISLSGFLGGLVSSTAVTKTMSDKSKESKGNVYLPFVIATILASSVMFIRVLVEVSAVNSTLLPSLIYPLGAAFLVSMIPVSIWWGKAKTKKEANLDLKSPFSLRPSIHFAMIFLVVQLVVGYMIAIGFGNSWIVLTGIISGITDVDAITLSVANLSKEGMLTATTATSTIVAAVLTNTAIKGGIAWIWGSSKFRNRVVAVIALCIAIGIGMVLLF